MIIDAVRYRVSVSPEAYPRRTEETVNIGPGCTVSNRATANFAKVRQAFRISSVMAYTISPPPTLSIDKPFTVGYNVTMAVGQNKPNNDDDVMLVQLCLQQICNYILGWRKIISPDDIQIDADGKCGPITKNAIWRFQTQWQRFGRSVYPDGVVDPFSSDSATTSTGHESTMLLLNFMLREAIGETRFDNLENESITPPLLRSKLHGTLEFR